MSADATINIDAPTLERLVQRVFVAVGLAPEAAATVGTALVDADREGRVSHGVMLVPMYIERIRAGSVSLATKVQVVHDQGAVVVLDAGNALGQLTADQSMELAVERALQFGLGAAAVRHAFHFGTASRYALAAVSKGCIGIAMCNTRPLMPAPGGAERMVGNNPIAIAMPTDGDVPVVLDMALSEVAMGKIRMADTQSRSIPSHWAADADGVATTDPAAAIAGMLLPAAGPKGFGLALMIDLLCGVLSSGAWGAQVQPLYGDSAIPYDCSHFFLAIDAAHFRAPASFRAEVAAAAARIRASKPAPGQDRIYSPGEIEWQRQEDSRQSGDAIALSLAVAQSLRQVAGTLQVELPELEALL